MTHYLRWLEESADKPDEFDTFTRECCIEEIKSLRAMLREHAGHKLNETCAEAIDELNKLRQQYIRDTLPDAQRDVVVLLTQYDEWIKENKNFTDIFDDRMWGLGNYNSGLKYSYLKLKEFIELKRLEKTEVTEHTPAVRGVIYSKIEKVMSWFKGGN